MKQRRLYWLLLLMVAVAVFRFLAPSHAEKEITVSAAAPPVPLVVATTAVTVVEPQQAEIAPQQVTTGPDAAGEPGNAFAVRKPKAVEPPPAPAAAKMIQIAAPIPPPAVSTAPPPPPPPPLQVIGTWNDGKTSGVFIAAPLGTVLAKLGTVLMAEYQVTQVTATQVSLLHIASKRELSIPVPRAATRP